MTDREKARWIVLEHLYMIGARSRFEADQPLGHHQVVLVDDILDAIVEARKEGEAFPIGEYRKEWLEVVAKARIEALEEAAQKVEHYEAPIWSVIIAQAIRALKEKK